MADGCRRDHLRAIDVQDPSQPRLLGAGEVGHSPSSLSLVRFDPVTGQLTHAGDWPFAGILPEGIAFDASDRGAAG